MTTDPMWCKVAFDDWATTRQLGSRLYDEGVTFTDEQIVRAMGRGYWWLRADDGRFVIDPDR